MDNKFRVKAWIANRLDEAIKKSGMRIDAICEKSGMPYSTLNSKRKGHSTVSFEDVTVLAPILGVPFSYFIPPQFSNAPAHQLMA